MIRKTAVQYLKIFREWQKEALKSKNYNVVSAKNHSKQITIQSLTRSELQNFRQCYTTDKTTKYYKARHQLPKYWFLSDKGTLLTVANGKVELYTAYITKKTLKAREQYKISKYSIGVDPAVLVGFVFGCDCTSKAEKLINCNGLRALQVGIVDLHHKKGYAHAKNADKLKEELKKNRIKNCKLKDILFCTHKEHDMLTYMPNTNSITAEAEYKQSQRIINTYPDIKVPIVIVQDNNQGGYITENVEDIKNIFNSKNQVLSLIQTIRDKNGNLRQIPIIQNGKLIQLPVTKS